MSSALYGGVCVLVLYMVCLYNVYFHSFRDTHNATTTEKKKIKRKDKLKTKSVLSLTHAYCFLFKYCLFSSSYLSSLNNSMFFFVVINRHFTEKLRVKYSLNKSLNCVLKVFYILSILFNYLFICLLLFFFTSYEWKKNLNKTNVFVYECMDV